MIKSRMSLDCTDPLDTNKVCSTVRVVVPVTDTVVRFFNTVVPVGPWNP